jgi:hypothetical protein
MAAPGQALAHAGYGRAGSGQSGSGPAAEARLWRPTAFGASPWLAPATRQAPATRRAGAPGGWQSEPTPNPGGLANGTLAAISCGGPRACLAVGSYVNGAGTTVTLAQAWNGTAWQTQVTPSPAGAGGSQLTGLSCEGPYACTAVGYYLDPAGVVVPLAERWNGASWRIQAVPRPAAATASGLFAISCHSALACTAVGSYNVSTGQALPLAEIWNGKSWHAEATPSPAGAAATELGGVSCAAARACIAVGAWQGSSGALMTVAEVWNGVGWHIQHTPGVSGATSTEFTGVSCAAAYACTASGYFANSTGADVVLAERWNGSGWQVQPTPTPAGVTASELGGVSCPSLRACTAAGTYVTGSGARGTVAEAWNGSAWTIQATPNPAGSTVNQLDGVSCPSVSTCVSAGSKEGSSGFDVPLGEGWNGTRWSLQASASPTGARISALAGVSCASATVCTAVGSFQKTPETNATLAEGWNGTKWSIQPTPNPAGSIYTGLQAVSCPAPSACIAVGSYLDHPNRPTFALAEAWNGTNWSIQSMPTPAGSQYTSLQAVSCTSPDACTATGSYRNHAGVGQGLAERWNGTNWSIQAIAEPSKVRAMNGVDCTYGSTCTAVGWYSSSTGTPSPLAEVWNGTSWSVQTVPLPTGSQGAVFSAVSCTSPSACTATGNEFANPGGVFAGRWNGTSWSIQAAPNPPNTQTSSTQPVLSTVSCRLAQLCVAIGNYSPDNVATAFAEAWNGTTWALQPIDLPPWTASSTLTGTSCAAGHCVSVGSYFGPSQLPVTLAVATSG